LLGRVVSRPKRRAILLCAKLMLRSRITMSEDFITTHRAKHLLAHVLAAAGAHRWPACALGKSGETPTGFFADFALDGPPDPTQLTELADDMARLLRTFQIFEPVRLAPAEALKTFAHNPWKRRLIEAIAENESEIQCYALDAFIDVCDCALKATETLRRVHPEKFILTTAHPVVWTYRGRDEFFIRITGELFPAIAPCECCVA
jgi:threonyl-tRNA synthetase